MKYVYLMYVMIRWVIIVFGIGGLVLFFVSPEFLGLTFISAASLLTLKLISFGVGIIAAVLRNRRLVNVKFGGYQK